jgi:hypothetical protein
MILEENIEGILGVMIPIVAIVGGLSLGFAGFYLRSRERMELINRGMDPSQADSSWFDRRRRRSPLRSGLTLLGVGAGLFVAYILCHTVITDGRPGEEHPVIYAGCIVTFIGIARILTYIIEKNEPENTDKS